MNYNHHTVTRAGFPIKSKTSSLCLSPLSRGAGHLIRLSLLSVVVVLGLAISASAQAQGVVVSPSSLELDEGGVLSVEKTRKTIRVKLSRKPDGERKVILQAEPEGTDVRLSKPELTFKPTEWNTYQEVHVIAIHDEDAVNDPNSKIKIQVGEDASTAVSVPVLIQDDKQNKVVISSTSLSVVEGSTTTFNIRLAEAPAFDRKVKLKITDKSKYRISLDKEELTFTKNNWNSDQTVSVTAQQDGNARGGTATITPQLRKIEKINDDSAAYKWKPAATESSSEAKISVKVIDDDLGPILEPSTLKIEEGQTATFTVRLDAKPKSSLDIALASSDGSKVSFDTEVDAEKIPTTSLRFTKSNWGTPQTVKVITHHDGGKADEYATITLTSSDLPTKSITVTVDDDDDTEVIGLNLSELPVVSEGGSAEFTVALASKPSNDRTVALTVLDNTDVKLNKEELTFTKGNWDSAKTVKVKTVQDADSTDDIATIRLAGDGITAQSVRVTVDDDEDGNVGLTLAKTSVEVNEGSSNTFTVQLASAPANNRIVALGSDNPDVTFSPISLSFDSSNWNNPRSVTINAASDQDKTNDSATITLGGDGINSALLQVSIIDDDDADVELVLSDFPSTLTEGASETFQVRLKTPPGKNRTVNLAAGNAYMTVDIDPDMIGSQTALTFTTSNWNISQSVTLTAIHDDNANDENVTIRLSGSGITTKSETVKIIDDDVRLKLSATSLTMLEKGRASFTVQLETQPDSNRTVTLASGNSDVTVDANPDTSGNQTVMIFTPGNWNIEQTVTLHAAEDAGSTDDTAIINLTGDGITAASVTVKVLEVIQVDRSTNIITVDEGTSTTTFNVWLESQPSSNRVIDLTTSYAGLKVAAGSAPAGRNLSLTFTPGNWNTRQTVTVSVDQNTDTADRDEFIQFNLGSGLEYKDGVSQRLGVRIRDDDAVLVLSNTSLNVNEGGSETFTVKLAARPIAEREVSLAPSGSTDVTVSPAMLTFPVANWNIPQTVTVRAAEDGDKTDDSGAINLSGAGIAASSVAVTVIDNDDGAVGLTFSSTSVVVTEGGSGIFTVKLSAKPGKGRTVTLASSNSDVTVSPAKLDFTGGDDGNWDEAQTVTITAAHDPNANNDTARITFTGGGITTGSAVDVTVDDDEDSAVSLILSDALLTMTEGQPATFTVGLSSAPGNSRTVTLSSTNPEIEIDTNASATGNQTTLTFTTAEWETVHTVTLTAAEDKDNLNDSAKVYLNGDGISTASVTVTVTDNDDTDVGLTLSPTSLTVNEGGSRIFTVRLAKQPGKDRTVTLKTVNADAGISLDKTTLTFTTSDWGFPQSVTVRAGQDDNGSNESATIKLAGDGVTDGSVTVKVVDDDVELGLSATSLTVNEGGVKTFQVRLKTLPIGSRTVYLATSSSKVAVSPTGLNFSPSNWNTFRTVTVRAADDGNEQNEIETITLSGAGVLTQLVGVSVIDDDADIGLILSPSSLTVTESTWKTFTVKLAAPPGKGRTVNLSSNNSDVTVSPTSLSFSPSNWNSPKTVTVRVADDGNESDESAKITLKGSDITTSKLAVSVIDDDGNDLELIVSHSMMTVTEGASKTFTVELNAPPGYSRTVCVTDNHSEVTLSRSSLVFTDFNWDIPQTVTVRVIDDSDGVHEKATVDLYGPGIPSEWVKISITDDDYVRPIRPIIPPEPPECRLGGICPDPGVEIQ